MKSKNVVIIIFLLIVLVLLISLNSKTDFDTNLSKNEVEDILIDAKSIIIKEINFKIRKYYKVYVDDTYIGKVTGKYVKVIGDKFTFEAPNGEIIASEEQIKRYGLRINRFAKVYDADDNIIGYIGEEKIKHLFELGYHFYFYDSNKNKIGTNDQVVFELLSENKFFNNDGNLIYELNQIELFPHTYEIKVENNSFVSPIMAIFMTCIEDAIIDAK